METVWLPRASADLQEIESYVHLDNPAAADALAWQIVTTVGLLGEQPALGRPGRVSGTRELIVPGTPYLVAYSVMRRRITILAILHGARQWPGKFERY